MSLKSEPDRYKSALKVDFITSNGGGGYRHLIGKPVLLDNQQTRNNDTYYGDVDWSFYGDDKWMENLEVRCQGCDSDEPRNLYCWSIEYRDAYSITLDKAERMHKTLKRIEAGMDKLRDQWGTAASFTEYLLRAAKVMKVEFILIRSLNPHESDYRYRCCNPADARYAIDRVVAEWVAAGQPAAAVA